MPEKHAGLTDIETIYRQRYVDLMSNKDSREVFVKRNKIVQSIRKNLEEAGFLEVETPMMHPIPGGANAKLSIGTSWDRMHHWSFHLQKSCFF